MGTAGPCTMGPAGGHIGMSVWAKGNGTVLQKSQQTTALRHYEE